MKPFDITETELRRALKEAGSVTAAAVSLGISRRSIYRLMDKFGIEIKRIVA